MKRLQNHSHPTLSFVLQGCLVLLLAAISPPLLAQADIIDLKVELCESGVNCHKCADELPGLLVLTLTNADATTVSARCDRPSNPRRTGAGPRPQSESRIRWTLDPQDSKGETLLVAGKTLENPPEDWSPLAYRPSRK